MDYTEFYYTHVVGCYSGETDRFWRITDGTIAYMIDSGISQAKILRALEDSGTGEYLTPSMLPDWLWEDSLVKRETYYYHNILQMTSRAPRYDIHTEKESIEKFWLEIKIRFTVEDLLAYFYKILKVNEELRDPKRDVGSFRFLLSKYRKIRIVEPLDFILLLLDFAGRESALLASGALSIAQYESPVFERMKAIAAQAGVQKTNRIVWRTARWMDS